MKGVEPRNKNLASNRKCENRIFQNGDLDNNPRTIVKYQIKIRERLYLLSFCVGFRIMDAGCPLDEKIESL